MRVRRLEFGWSRIGDKVAWRSPEFGISKPFCGCYMAEFWCAYITWLGDQCYYQCGDPECDCVDACVKRP